MSRSDGFAGRGLNAIHDCSYLHVPTRSTKVDKLDPYVAINWLEGQRSIVVSWVHHRLAHRSRPTNSGGLVPCQSTSSTSAGAAASTSSPTRPTAATTPGPLPAEHRDSIFGL